MLTTFLHRQGRGWSVAKLPSGDDSFHQLLGEYTVEPFAKGHYHLLRSNGYPDTYLITRIDTDGDGEIGSYVSLDQQDLAFIAKEGGHAYSSISMRTGDGMRATEEDYMKLWEDDRL
ncbi:hypothetical protein LOK74_04870 [Brevibacillus humidisoli]|uniref:hypothetical protein n=1 Tax=Brevibacillus humidisoli TaxID=2895522 RepID=UPI001E38B9CB|nr:hypothetical protein [Brevibacillus humidisoli]UFJ41839.1 hypothetical protein LOK74_04870 [Brevibacillus humidisoli]